MPAPASESGPIALERATPWPSGPAASVSTVLTLRQDPSAAFAQAGRDARAELRGEFVALTGQAERAGELP
ncbi:hypothetical protein GCM10010435_83730 [Winogradskya consettensis]